MNGSTLRPFAVLIIIIIYTNIQACNSSVIFCTKDTFKNGPVYLKRTQYTTCNGSNPFCFFISSELQDLCMPSSANYSFKLSSLWGTCKRFNQNGMLPCQLGATGLTCQLSQLDQCQMEQSADCFLNVSVLAIITETIFNQFTLKMDQFFKSVINQSHQVKTLHLKVKSAKEIQAIWSRPHCPSRHFSYYWKYTVPGSNVSKIGEEGMFDSNEEGEQKALIQELKPFTNYTVCIMTRVDGSFDFLQGVCQTAETLQGVPSKSPVIISTTPSSLDDKTWQCILRWKLVDKQYWNGIIRNTSIDVYKNGIVKALSVTAPVDEECHVIGPLDRESQYSVVVRLCNEVACSSSKKKFISIVRKDATHSGIVVALSSAALLAVIVLLAVLFVRCRKRRHRRTASTEYPVQEIIPDAYLINPVQHVSGNEISHEDTNPYDEIKASGTPENTLRNDSVNRWAGAETKREELCKACRCEGACVCNRNYNNFVMFNCAGKECRWEEGTSCFGAGDLRSGGLVMIANERRYDLIDDLESSEDESSRSETDKLQPDKFLRSLSFEMVPLVPYCSQ